MTSTGSRHTPVWFDVSTPDASRARRFYQEMFDLPMNPVGVISG